MNDTFRPPTDSELAWLQQAEERIKVCSTSIISMRRAKAG